MVQKIKSEITGEILVQNGPKVNTGLFSPNDVINVPPQLKLKNISREKKTLPNRDRAHK